MSARSYAETIGREVAALDTVLGGNAAPEELAAAVAYLEMEHAGPEDVAHVWLRETVLDLTVLVGRDRSRVELLRTCGGPHCEITRDTSDGDAVEIHVWDGPNRYVHRMTPTAVAHWLDEIAETGA